MCGGEAVLTEGIGKAKRGGRRDWLRRKRPFDSLRPYYMNAQTLWQQQHVQGQH